MPFINQRGFSALPVTLKTAGHLLSLPPHLLKQVQKWMMLSLRSLKVQVTWNYSSTVNFQTGGYSRQLIYLHQAHVEKIYFCIKTYFKRYGFYATSLLI